MKKIKTGVVGVGALGKHHLKWYNQLEQSELIGFYDIDSDTREKYAREHDVTAFESLEEFAKNVEAASIVVPTTAHFETASFLLENDCHLLIEKPVTATTEEAAKLDAIVRKSGKVVTVGQIERFNPAVVALREKKISPTFIEAHRLAAFDMRGTDVAVISDLMIHDIDLVLMLVDSRVTDIQASAVDVISDRADIANARITFENGAVAKLTASRISLSPMRKLRIFQKSGYYSLDLAKKQADFYTLATDKDETGGMKIPLGKSGKELSYIKITDSGKDMLGEELSSFLNSIINQTPPDVPVIEAQEALRVALDIEKIAQQSLKKVVESGSL